MTRIALVVYGGVATSDPPRPGDTFSVLDVWELDGTLNVLLDPTTPRLPCGHRASEVHQTDEGTAHCTACERQARSKAGGRRHGRGAGQGTIGSTT